MASDLGTTSEPLSFVEYRRDLDVYEFALANGVCDASFVSLVQDLDSKIVAATGTGFRQTPVQQLFFPSAVAAQLGREVYAKVETANVAGSHKARHLFGLLIWMAVEDLVSAGSGPRPPKEELVIASCGNAALGAATLAFSLDRKLRVFVPVDADPNVLGELERLNATVQMCERQPGQLGDPCVAELSNALDRGAEAFTVQGTTCPNVIDGGRTIGLELAAQLRDLDAHPTDIYIQVGGAALGAATMDGLARAAMRRAKGRRPEAPMRVHPVQPANAHPYIAMWERLRSEFAPLEDGRPVLTGQELRSRISNRSEAMQPWPGTPSSIASGILDDITYDWQGLLYHQVAGNGWPVEATEDNFMQATTLLRDQVSPRPDATGAAGLAGLLADERRSEDDSPAVVLVTGVDRTLSTDETQER